MPPFSKELWEEGAQVKSFKLVKKGKFDEEGVIRILRDEPAQYPGCSGTRTLSDVSCAFLTPLSEVLVLMKVV
jgi:5-oxoprolinase (ATP-hydrolysing)